MISTVHSHIHLFNNKAARKSSSYSVLISLIPDSDKSVVEERKRSKATGEIPGGNIGLEMNSDVHQDIFPYGNDNMK